MTDAMTTAAAARAAAAAADRAMDAAAADRAMDAAAAIARTWKAATMTEAAADRAEAAADRAEAAASRAAADRVAASRAAEQNMEMDRATVVARVAAEAARTARSAAGAVDERPGNDLLLKRLLMWSGACRLDGENDLAGILTDARTRILDMRVALRWCSGNPAFAPEGEAGEGWKKCCAHLL